jgi:hypothetical protein
LKAGKYKSALGKNQGFNRSPAAKITVDEMMACWPKRIVRTAHPLFKFSPPKTIFQCGSQAGRIQA